MLEYLVTQRERSRIRPSLATFLLPQWKMNYIRVKGGSVGMLEYLRTSSLQKYAPGFEVDSHQRLIRTPTRKYPSDRLLELPHPVLAIRVVKSPTTPYTGIGIRITSLWDIWALCTDGLEYSSRGNVKGLGISRMVEYMSSPVD